MDDLQLTERVAGRGDVIEVEDVYELTEAAAAYLASHPLTDAGAKAAPDPGAGGSLHENLRAILTGPQTQVFNALVSAGTACSRDLLATCCGWSTNSSNIRDRLSELARLDIIERPSPGVVALQAWVNE